MKLIQILAFVLLTQSVYGQVTRKEMAESNIYIRSTFFDQKNDFIGLQLRTEIKDTIINNRGFLKIITEDFDDYSKIDNTDIYYESFLDGTYILLDKSLNVVHSLNYNETRDQDAILFGDGMTISLEFIDTRRNLPRDSLISTDATPRKFFKSDNSEIYAVIIPDLKTVAVSSNGTFYTKQLFGDNYNDISEGVKNDYAVSNRFDIQIGDEIQLFYRRKWYNDSTSVAEYQDKQYKNVKYLGDTILDAQTAMRLEVEGYNYLSGSKDGPEEFLLPVVDSGYYYGRQFIPFKNYRTELKIEEQSGNKGFFLQGVSIDSINGFSYQKIIQARPDPYRYFILPFFPMPYVEFGNVQGVVTYAKIKGIEKGTKRERTYITDENNLRDALSISKTEVKVEIYFLNEFEIDIKIVSQDGQIGSLQTKSKEGLHSYIVKTESMEKNKPYKIQVSYKREKQSGSFSSGFKSGY